MQIDIPSARLAALLSTTPTASEPDSLGGAGDGAESVPPARHTPRPAADHAEVPA